MPTLRDVVLDHLRSTGAQVREFAIELGISPVSLRRFLSDGQMPQEEAVRENLCRHLGLSVQDGNLFQTAGQACLAEGPSLREVVARAMEREGLTERAVARLAGVSHGAVRRVTREGALAQRPSLEKIAQVLKIPKPTLEAAVANSRAARQVPTESAEEGSVEDTPHLSELVYDLILTRSQSIAAFAKDLGIGYLVMARFIETGVPPEDAKTIGALRHVLELEDVFFNEALRKSQQDPQPAPVNQFDHMVGPSGSPLQVALAKYMREHRLTLKSLALKAGLSQVTISRLIKRGQAPTRAATHVKLQSLLNLTPEQYDEMLAQPAAALTASHRKKKKDPAKTEEYEPHDHTTDHPAKQPAVVKTTTAPAAPDDGLETLIAKLSAKQRSALIAFIKAL